MVKRLKRRKANVNPGETARMSGQGGEGNGRNAWQTFWFTVRIAPSSFGLMLLVGLFDSCLAVARIYLTSRVFARVEACLGGTPASDLYPTLACYGLCLFLDALHLYWYTRFYVQFREITRFEGKVLQLLHGKSGRISNEQLELPQAWAFIRQSSNARQMLFRFVEICIDLVTGVIQTAVVTAYASAFHLWYALFLPLAVLCPFLELLYQANLWKKDYERISLLEREENEYEKAMTDETACKESRLTGAGRVLREKWESSCAKKVSLEDRKSKKLFNLRFGLSFPETAGAIGGFILSLLLYRAGKVSLGGFSAGMAAYGSLMSSYRMLLQMAGEHSRYWKMTQPFFRYWDFEERDKDGKAFVSHCSARQIELKDVCFAYPNQNRNAIDHVNLTLNEGEVLAIVGENGAGKTTLVNLLLGLYRPTSGEVLYDGADIRNIRENELHREQSAVFQQFNRYQMTVGENIGIGDFEREDQEKIAAEIREIFSGRENAAAMKLGKEFGGVELSGGEWQRLACARGFYRDSRLVVLDEASSAIDPLREKEIYDRFARELTGKTGILVTHRLGAVNLADRIIVLAQGKICEQGTHRELLGQGGIYASLWKEQAAGYKDSRSAYSN